ncbi:unnamed protein product [Rotaria sordida]|uniref:Uncharacterized protein n=1 Tax=Rotaria sordida TaxID=392033 RepID=A0A813ZNP1_9BILA|nr:unnamed protein product [Rotaria sordida]CAF0902061.1 unnamed protein product [Rotaria sordida]
MDQNTSISISNKKFQIYADHDHGDNNHLIKSHFLNQHYSFRLTSLIFPILLSLLLIIGALILILSITRLHTCHQQQLEQTEAILGYKSDSHTKTWLPCVKTNISSCVCPATFIHSLSNPFHCIPNYSRCLKSCQHNLHCKCYNLIDPNHCRIVTRNWIENELKAKPIERFHNRIKNNLLQYTWMDNFNYQLERLLSDKQSNEYLFLSPDRRTGITIHEQHHDYILNERWTKIEINTTRQHVVYTQLDPQTHLCRMSSLYDNGSIIQGPIHTCPSSSMVPPYFLGVACNDILVLWQDSSKISIQRQEGWTNVRHNFQSIKPYLSVLFDPFHRYYSLYANSMIEIKDLNGDILAQFFTDIIQPIKFEFLDQHGTIWIANETHMQTFHSTNDQIWLDF